nr:histone deacetylase 14 isoform X2 [Tanacetum cinerariifolium]
CNPTPENLVLIRLTIDTEGQRGCRFFFWFDDHILLSSLISTFSDKLNCKNDQVTFYYREIDNIGCGNGEGATLNLRLAGGSGDVAM